MEWFEKVGKNKRIIVAYQSSRQMMIQTAAKEAMNMISLLYSAPDFLRKSTWNTIQPTNANTIINAITALGAI
jgi:hypothetical protein